MLPEPYDIHERSGLYKSVQPAVLYLLHLVKQGILTEAGVGGYGLTVIGSHGPQSRSVFSLDDVTLQVLAGADRPVLIMPAEE